MERTELGDLSPEAVLLLGYLRGQGGLAHVSTDLGMAPRIAREAADELRAAGLLQDAHGQVRLRPLAQRRQPSEPSAAEKESHRWQRSRLASVVASRGNDSGRDESVRIVHSNLAAQESLVSIFASARQEILALSPAPTPGYSATASVIEAKVRSTEDERLIAGVSSTWLCHTGMLAHPERALDVARGLSRGQHVLLAPHIVSRMVIVDRTVAMLPIHPVRHLVGAQVLSDPETVAQLVAVFLELAEQGTAVPVQREVSALERETLRLMAAGEKDEAIARRLAMSPRTVRRSIAGLLAASGAENRFQLALHAMQVGWLSPEAVAPRQPTEPRRRAPQETGPVGRLP